MRIPRRSLAATLVLLGILAAPYLHGYVVAPPGSSFLGFVGPYRNDQQSYLGWIRQATDGHLLFRDLFTTEPHRRVFFHPLFLAMGFGVRWTGIPVLALWYAAHAAGCVALLWTARRLTHAALQDGVARGIALGWIATASGFGWLTDPSAPPEARPIDLTLPEASGFHTISSSFFTLPVAQALLTGTFLLLLRGAGRRRDALAAGALGALLGFIHPYDLAPLFAVATVWTLLDLRRRGPHLCIAAAGWAVPVAYYAAVIVPDPVFGAQARESLATPGIWADILGFGLPLLAAIAAVALPSLRRTCTLAPFLAVWAAVQLALVSLPSGWGRKLLLGVHLPLCLLGAAAAAAVLRGAAARVTSEARRRALVAGGAALLVAFAGIGSALAYRDLFLRNQAGWAADFVPDSYSEAFDWFEAHGEAGDVVLAPEAFAQNLPGRTGLTVFVGHWSQTLDRDRKVAFVAGLFQDTRLGPAPEVEAILSANGVRYLALDAMSRLSLGIAPERWEFVFSPRAPVVFDNGDVVVWERGDRPGRAAP